MKGASCYVCIAVMCVVLILLRGEVSVVVRCPGGDLGPLT